MNTATIMQQLPKLKNTVNPSNILSIISTPIKEKGAINSDDALCCLLVHIGTNFLLFNYSANAVHDLDNSKSVSIW